MGFFDKLNPWQGAALGAGAFGPLGAAGGFMLGRKNDLNAEIDAQMQGGPPPSDLNPDEFKQYMEGPGFQAMKGEALSAPGQSPYAKYAMEQQAGREGVLSDQAAKLASAQEGQAMSRLAQSGGLSSAARDSLAMRGLASGAQGRADVGRQGMDTRAGIMMDAEKQRQGALRSFGGMEQEAGNLYAGIKRGNQEMANQRYGAQMMANAEREAGRPKGLLGLNFLGL